MPPMKMEHVVDPADTIRDTIGSLKDFTLFGNRLLLGIYQRPKITKTGIHLSDNTVAEDEHQGKAALVLMKGPTAFVSDDNYDFHGQDIKVGDWVSIFISDGRKIMVNKQLCRIVEDQHIMLKIPAPDSVY